MPRAASGTKGVIAIAGERSNMYSCLRLQTVLNRNCTYRSPEAIMLAARSAAKPIGIGWSSSLGWYEGHARPHLERPFLAGSARGSRLLPRCGQRVVP
jgi:hypothetical protein